MNKERFKTLLKSSKWKLNSATVKVISGRLFIFLNLKRYEVTENEGRMMFTSREGRTKPADRLLYKNRVLN